MRKFIFLITTLMLVASGLATGQSRPQPDCDAPVEYATADSVKSDSSAVRRLGRKIADGAAEAVDSIGAAAERVGNHPVSRRIADGAEETFDSISAAGQRFGKKAKVWSDSIAARTRRALKTKQQNN